MNVVERDLKFRRDNSTVVYKDKVMVDLSKVQQNAQAKIYSGVTADFQGTPTRFAIDGSLRPFNIQMTSLSPKGLVLAIVENRLEVDGMVVDENIQDAYEFLWERDIFTKNRA